MRTLLGWYRAGEDVEARLPIAVDLPRAIATRARTYWYLSAAPELLALAADPARRLRAGDEPMSPIAPTLQASSPTGWPSSASASPRTIAAYRDTLKLLLRFVQQRTGKRLPALGLGRPRRRDDHARSSSTSKPNAHNSARTRNLRLTAIRSLFTYAALRHPEHAALIQRVLAIPAKRFDKTTRRRSSPPPRSTHSSPHPTPPDGKAAATGHCCSWPSRPDCACPS